MKDKMLFQLVNDGVKRVKLRRLRDKRRWLRRSWMQSKMESWRGNISYLPIKVSGVTRDARVAGQATIARGWGSEKYKTPW
jgi:hypothetical protein